MGKRRSKRPGEPARGGRRQTRYNPIQVLQENAMFEKYYDSQSLYEPGEKEEFWAVLKRELPNSFRFTGSKSHALQVQRRLCDHYIPEITSITHEGQLVEPPTPLPWYPNQLAWQMNTPKQVIRRFPPFASFQKFLVSETATGSISRQEAVSMIPPLLLDVKPGMTVLDLCASPGSKAAQLIEMIHGGEESRIRKTIRDFRRENGRSVSPEGEDTQREIKEEELQSDWADYGRSTGLLIANDVDWKRANMLVHQMKRLNSPNLIVTNHDATYYPSIKLHSEPSASGAVSKGRYLKFDRILADVPCSGDGTVRKNYTIWRDWHPGNGLGLHQVQVRILVRALQMLKVGGRVVYSTCSMNPVENEAVVAAAIDRCGGLEHVELVDCAAALPELRRRSGMNSWKVIGRDGKEWSSWEEVLEHKAAGGPEPAGKLSASVFPSYSADKVPLERCLRICAHYQDTGAFFIAVLQKRKEIRARPEETTDSLPTQHKSAKSAPISAIISELEEKKSSVDPAEHIKAADNIRSATLVSDEEADDSTPAMRQNEGSEPTPRDDRKRKLSNADQESSSKRLVSSGEIVSANGNDNEDRKVHFPPPPGAQLDLTAHDMRTPQVEPIGKGTDNKLRRFEEYFRYLDPSHEVIRDIYATYGISNRFPQDRFLVRNESGIPSKKIYYTSALSREILTENDGKGLKFVHAGILMFVKQDVQKLPNACPWRLQAEGIHLIEGWVSESCIVRLYKKETLRKLLLEMFPKVSGGAHTELGEIGDQVLSSQFGCRILRVEKGTGEDAFGERMVFPLWRSRHSLNLMLHKEDRKALLLRIYNDTTPLVDHTKLVEPGENDDLTPEHVVDDAQEEKIGLEVEQGRTVGSEHEAEDDLGETHLSDIQVHPTMAG